MARKDVKEIIEDNLGQIEEWAKNGLTIAQIAKNLGVSESTLYRWQKKEGSKLGETLKKGRQPAITELENTMYNSACGYERKVKKYAKVKRCIYDKGKKLEEWEEMVEYEETTYYPPDTTAGIFLLKNWANYMNEPRAMEIRKREVELREKQVEAQIW